MKWDSTTRRSPGGGRGRIWRRAFTTGTVVAVLASLAVAPASAQPTTQGGTLPAETITDIAYAPPVPPNTQGNLLDLFLPERTEGSPVPLFIWTSGSAWFSDNGKVGADFWADHFNEAGFAVAGVSVRSSFQVQFPGQLHDIKSAIRFLRHHAGDYGLDPERFAIAGNSSGGWTAAMAGVTGDVDDDLEGNRGVVGGSSRVQAVVDFYGPTNFLLMDSQEPSIIEHDSPNSPESLLIGCAIQTCPELTERANPLNYVSDDDPPFLVFHGTADPLVPHGQSRILYEEMRGNCNDVRFHSVPGIGHTHSYVTNTGQAQNQTTFTSSGCVESVNQGFEGGTEPDRDYIEAFLRDAFASQCSRTITGSHAGPLTVTEGVACLDAGSRVTGPVTVRAGAGLIATGARVTGPLRAVGAREIRLTGSRFTGPITIRGTDQTVVVRDNRITGPVRLSDNTTGITPIVVAGNRVIGPLACTSNQPPPANGGSSNQVIGPTSGQCSDL